VTHRWAVRLLATLWLAALGFGFAPRVGAAEEPVVTARAAILMDARTGQVLFERDADKPLPVASLTKLMTLVLAFRAIQRGRAHLDDLVPVSEAAYRTEGSQIWLEPGERLPLRQMLTAIAVGSANDAAVAVAEYLAGSTDRFVAAMNAEAAQLGMRHTHFANPHGLSAPDHYSTARDMALLARVAVRMPALLALTRQWQDRSIRNGRGGTLWLVNHNRLLRTYPGVDGLKTGYTRQAGYCLVATARRGSTRLIAVVLGAPTSAARFDSAANLLTWGFGRFRTVTLVERGAVVGRVRVLRGRAEYVDAVAGRAAAVTVLRSHTPQVTQTVALPTAVGAPVRAGQALGSLTVREEGRVLAVVPLVAGQAVRGIAWPELVWRYFWQMVSVGAVP
jgi:D-alanyl-D-alanine carboxypeptidase (penicillin-binding protein 5/6)